MKDYHESVSPAHIEAFKVEWGRITQAGSPYINSHEIVPIVLNLDPPMGMKGERQQPKDVITFLRRKQLRRQLRGPRRHMVCYVDMLHALCAASVKPGGREIQNERLQRNLDEQLAAQICANAQSLGAREHASTAVFDLTAEFDAATGLQSIWRARRARRRVRLLREGAKLRQAPFSGRVHTAAITHAHTLTNAQGLRGADEANV